MKAASVRELKAELQLKSSQELIELCLQLSKFKKDNKELLTYLLFEAQDETAYINHVKELIDIEFEDMNAAHVYYVKKSLRKILRITKKHIQYSKKKQTEAELLLHYCQNLREMNFSVKRSSIIMNIYERQVKIIEKAIASLPEDLQYDYEEQVDALLAFV